MQWDFPLTERTEASVRRALWECEQGAGQGQTAQLQHTEGLRQEMTLAGYKGWSIP